MLKCSRFGCKAVVESLCCGVIMIYESIVSNDNAL